MPGPGLPFILSGSRDPSDRPRFRDMFDRFQDPGLGMPGGQPMASPQGPNVEALLQQHLFQGQAPEPYQPPIVPFRSQGRPMTLDEIGNAETGDPKPTWKNRLGSALEGAAAAGTLDPESDNPIESFLGAGLQTFTGVRQHQRAEQEHGQALDQQIVEAATKQRRQAAQDKIDEEYKRSQIAANNALAMSRLSGKGEDASGLDVGGLAAQLRESGFDDMATFVEANPGIVRKSPSSFLTLAGRGSQTANDEKTAEQARTRVERAEERATSQVLREENATDPETGTKKQYTPEQRVRRFNEVVRMFNRNYAADSTLASTIRGFQSAAKKAPPQGAAGGVWSDEVTAARELVKTLAPDVARRRLLNSGYSEEQIKEITGGR